MSSPCQTIWIGSDCGTFCVGCFRNLDEISGWMTYTKQQRKEIAVKLKTRRKIFLGGLKDGG
jgi:predicted Fe-S protein YdhL (DUF1289 family)